MQTSLHSNYNIEKIWLSAFKLSDDIIGSTFKTALGEDKKLYLNIGWHNICLTAKHVNVMYPMVMKDVRNGDRRAFEGPAADIIANILREAPGEILVREGAITCRKSCI